MKIGEVTSWLLRRTEDLNPRQQQLLADVRGHCAQLDRLGERVTGFAKMMTKPPETSNYPAGSSRWTPTTHPNCTPRRRDLAASPPG